MDEGFSVEGGRIVLIVYVFIVGGGVENEDVVGVGVFDSSFEFFLDWVWGNFDSLVYWDDVYFYVYSSFYSFIGVSLVYIINF